MEDQMKIGVVEVTCIVCGARHVVKVPKIGYMLWRSGQALIQDALPELSDDERELLLSNICPRCFDAAFAE